VTQETQQQASTEDASEVGAAGVVAVTDVRFEHLRDALGTGTAQPRLSWLIETERPGWVQAAYEVEAFDPEGQVWGRTEPVELGESVLVPWPFAPLSSRERVSVRVRVRGTDGSASAWSAPYPVEAGLLHPDDWSAQFMTPGWAEDSSRPQPSPMLRREFSVKAGLAQARLYVTALGAYEAQINGMPVGDHVLDPGWTSYNHRLLYQTHDVTPMLREGQNVIGAILGDGWYRGRLGLGGGRRGIYGDRLALLAQLEITYEDGSTDRIVTDESWRAATGPILSSDIYDGETYDARLERERWSLPGYDDKDWSGVASVKRDFGTLAAPTGPPVRRTEVILPVAISKSPSGRTLVDFGQNLVGRLRIEVQGDPGQTITLRHAEVLEYGELGTRPLRFAQATDRYTLRGGAPEKWEPRFTFHGFRYAEVEGMNEAGVGELRPEDISAVVLHSDMERTGWFECSDPLVNRLHENVVWSMRGNFLSIPTDCPQRDERLGWTGDIQVFAPTATLLYNSAGFLESWLQDLAIEQQAAGGVVAPVIPNILGEPPMPTAAWGDAAVFVPWVLYQRYRDPGILARQFESMRSWVDVMTHLAGESRLWDKGFQFGDWLDPAAPPDRPAAARTNPSIVATAYFARSAELVGLAARVLGRAEDASYYHGLAAEVRAAFQHEYITPAGRLMSDATTAYALAIEFALFRDPDQREHAGKELAALVRGSHYRISTGFVGTPLVCDALCSVGEHQAAFRLLTERDCPSWLYPVTMGATTIWERWDSMLPDGSINPGEMTSFNHYALGAVADWLHRVVGGLAAAAPGYRLLDIRPTPGGGLTHARVRHLTPFGLAQSAWEIKDDQITIEVVIPPNTEAIVSLPGAEGESIKIGSGTHRWSRPYPKPASRPALSLDNTLDEVIEDLEGWTTVRSIIARHDAELAGQIDSGGGISGTGSLSLRQVLAMRPNTRELQAELEAALAAGTRYSVR
jgi:alpha-L-rhamnosidase